MNIEKRLDLSGRFSFKVPQATRLWAELREQVGRLFDLCTMRIINYEPRYQPDFKRINVAWIAKDFVVEDVDLEVLDQPEANIIEKGGSIILALVGEEVAGTCALLKSAPGVYQMVKMAVDEKFRGQGIGRALGVAIIERARELNASKVILYSNTNGSATAVELYRKLGFTELPLPTQAYKRANIYMELPI